MNNSRVFMMAFGGVVKKVFTVIFISWLIYGCVSTGDHQEEKNENSVLDTLELNDSDSISMLVNTANSDRKLSDDSLVNNSYEHTEAFVGKVSYFEETQEYYTAVIVKKGVDFDFYELTNTCDSVIYDDAETSRKRLPHAIGIKYFEIIKSISIFTFDNQFMTNASFVRWEYLDDMIEGNLIAVFRGVQKTVIRPDNTRGMYAVEEGKRLQMTEKYRHFTVSGLKDKQTVCEFLSVRPDKLIFSAQINYDYLDVAFIFLSVGEYSDLEFQNAILFKQNGNLKLLKSEKSEFIYYGIQPTVIESNEYPVFIVGNAKPETDWIWFGIQAYMDGNYSDTKRNLLKVRAN